MLHTESEKMIFNHIRTLTLNALSDAIDEIKNTDYHDQVLTQKEAAKYLKVSPKTLIQLVKDGTVKRQKLGKQIRYLKSELKKSLQS